MPRADGEPSPSPAFRRRTLVLGRLELAVAGLRRRPEIVGRKRLGLAASGTRRDDLAATGRAADRDRRGPAAPVPARVSIGSSARPLAAARSASEPAGRDGLGTTSLAARLRPAASAAGHEWRSSGSSIAAARARGPAGSGRAAPRLAAG